VTDTNAGKDAASALLLLETAAGAVDKAVGDVESTTVQEAAQTLANLRVHIATLRQCEAGIERWIAQCFREEGWRDPVELPGVGMVEVRRSKNRRGWQYDALRSKWVNVFVPRWAELHEGEEPAPGDVMAALFECFTVTGAKVRSMKSIGIDVDDYCESEPGAPTVSIA
jgi:hypothetical protein